MSSSWKNQFSSPKSIKHRVGETDHYFWPMSVRVLVKLKAVGSPVINALSVLFNKTRRAQDVKQTQRSWEDGDLKGLDTVIEEISPEMAALRATEARDAIEEALTAVTDPENLGIMGDIIIDSLRKVFKPGDPDSPPGLEVAQFYDVIQMRQILTGLAKANAEVFGPFAQQVVAAVEGAMAQINKKQETPGETSTTESSPSSTGDSESEKS